MLRDQRARAAGADPAVPAAAARGRRRRHQHQLRRGRRGLRGLGRLRLVQGGARPADRGARRRGARSWRVYAVDPGDMRTEMHQAAFPGEDISDRPEPEAVVPALLRLLDERPPSGRTARRLIPRCLPTPPPSGRRLPSPPRLYARPGRARLRAADRPGGRRAAAGPRRRAAARRAGRAGIAHARFAELGELPRPRATCVVVNTSATLAAAVDGQPARRHGRGGALLHRARRRPWVVEVRPAGPRHRAGHRTRAPGERITLPAGAALVLDRPQPAGQARLWRARPAIDGGVAAFLARHGRPIRYAYVPRPWPLRGVPDRLRPRAGQRRDAERRAAVHRRAGHRPGHPRRS